MGRCRAEHGRHGAKGDSDPGFILLAAVWLLLLAGAVIAAMTLTALRESKAAHGARNQLAADMAVESAVQLVIADLIENGGRGRWGKTPASGTIMVDDIAVELSVTNEAGRLDLNEAEPSTIDGTLMGLGVAPDTRERVLGEVARLRLAKRRLGYWAELERLLALASHDGQCLVPLFTLWSGQAMPTPQQMPQALAKAMGQMGNIGGEPASTDTITGQVFRVVAQTREPSATRLIAMVRVTNWLGNPYGIHVWNRSAPGCERKAD